MKKILSAVLFALLAGTVTAGAEPIDQYSDLDLVQDRILVTLRSGVSVNRDKAEDVVKVGVASLDAAADRFEVHGMEPLYGGMTAKLRNKAGRDEADRVWAVDFPTTMDLFEVMAAYRSLPEVEKVEPVAYVPFDTAYLPNDPAIGNSQWYLRNMTLGGADVRAVGGWNQTLGDSNVVIAVIDSGVDWHHPDLGGDHPDKVNGSIWTNWEEYYGSPGVDDDNNGKVDDIRGWDFVNVGGFSVWPGEDASTPDNDPMDFGGHGTLVAGCIAPITGNGIGIAATAPGCKIMPVRAGYLKSDGDGTLRTDFISNAIVYAAANGADIINCSWTSSSHISTAVSLAQGEGVLLVTSAGNEDSNSNVNTWLSTVPYVLCVAATGSSDVKTSFSNYGSWVDVSAPGAGIYTTAYIHDTDTSTYQVTQGTSFSSPIVAGVAALIWSANPGWTYTQVFNYVKATCDDIDAVNPDHAGLLGTGRVNLLKALGDDMHRYPSEFPTLYDALNSSAAGDTVGIEGGEIIAGPLDIPGKAINVYGGYDASYATRDPLGNPVIVQGNVGNSVVRFLGDVTNATVLDGFLVQDGGGQIFSGIPHSGRYGGGIMLNRVSPTLRNLEITGNSVGNATTLGCGGGLAMNDCSPVLENVSIHGNTAGYGAGVFIFESSPTFIDCDITDNILVTDNATYPAKGGGIHLIDSTVDLTDCSISGHDGLDQGGGIFADGIGATPHLTMTGGAVEGNEATNGGAGIFINTGTLDLAGVAITDNLRSPTASFMYGGGIHAVNVAATLDSVQVTGNTAHVGAGIHLEGSASPSITRSVFTGNSARYWGGAIHLSGNTDGVVMGNTIADNAAINVGGAGIYVETTNVQISNNILAFNTGGSNYANGIALDGAPDALACNDVFGNEGADYSGIADPTGTGGNISVDPLFCNAGAGNFNLQTASPCTDANSGGCGLIGALTSGCGISPVLEETPDIPLAFEVEPNFPNPFNPMTTIRFALPSAARTQVTIFDVAGRHVKTLVDEDMAAQTHEVTWTGDDDRGRSVAAGVYFYLVTSGDQRSVGRMALVK